MTAATPRSAPGLQRERHLAYRSEREPWLSQRSLNRWQVRSVAIFFLCIACSAAGRRNLAARWIADATRSSILDLGRKPGSPIRQPPRLLSLACREKRRRGTHRHTLGY